MSRATCRAIWSRFHRFISGRRSPSNDKPLYENAGRDDLFWIDVAQFDDLLHLGHGALRRSCHDRSEIPRRLAVHEVSPPVALQRFDQGDVGMDGMFEQMG